MITHIEELDDQIVGRNGSMRQGQDLFEQEAERLDEMFDVTGLSWNGKTYPGEVADASALGQVFEKDNSTLKTHWNTTRDRIYASQDELPEITAAHKAELDAEAQRMRNLLNVTLGEVLGSNHQQQIRQSFTADSMASELAAFSEWMENMTDPVLQDKSNNGMAEVDQLQLDLQKIVSDKAAVIATYPQSFQGELNPAYVAAYTESADKAYDTSKAIRDASLATQELIDSAEVTFADRERAARETLKTLKPLIKPMAKKNAKVAKGVLKTWREQSKLTDKLDADINTTVNGAVGFSLGIMNDVFSVLEELVYLNSTAINQSFDSKAKFIVEDEKDTVQQHSSNWKKTYDDLKLYMDTLHTLQASTKGYHESTQVDIAEALKHSHKLNPQLESSGAPQAEAAAETLRKAAARDVQDVETMGFKGQSHVGNKEGENLRGVRAQQKKLRDFLVAKGALLGRKIDKQIGQVVKKATGESDTVFQSAGHLQHGFSIVANLVDSIDRLAVRNNVTVSNFPARMKSEMESTIRSATADLVASESARNEMVERIEKVFSDYEQEISVESYHAAGEQFIRESNSAARIMADDYNSGIHKLLDKVGSGEARDRGQREGEAHDAAYKDSLASALLGRMDRYWTAEDKLSKQVGSDATGLTVKEQADRDNLIAQETSAGEIDAEQQAQVFATLVREFSSHVQDTEGHLGRHLDQAERREMYKVLNMENMTEEALLMALGQMNVSEQQVFLMSVAGDRFGGVTAGAVKSEGSVNAALLAAYQQLPTVKKNLRMREGNTKYFMNQMLEEGHAQARLVANLMREDGAEMMDNVHLHTAEFAAALLKAQGDEDNYVQEAMNKMATLEQKDATRTASVARNLGSLMAPFAQSMAVRMHKLLDGDDAEFHLLKMLSHTDEERLKYIAQETADEFGDVNDAQAMLDSHFANIEQTAIGEILALAEDGVSIHEASRIKELEGESGQTLKQAKRASEDTAVALQRLTAGTDEGVHYESESRVNPQLPKILKKREETLDAFNELRSWIHSKELSIQNQVGDVRDTQMRVQRHIESREHELVEDLGGVHDELADMQRMAEYTNSSMVGSILNTLDKTMQQDDELQQMVDIEVQPQTDHWRDGVGEVFEHFGMGLDIEAIMAAAEEAFNKDQQLRMSAAAASGEVNIYLRNAQRLAEKALAESKRKLEEDIHAIMMNADLDAAAKAEMIRKLRAAHAEKELEMHTRAQQIVSSAAAAGLSLAQQQALLTKLVTAALASVDVEPPSRADLAQRRIELRSALDTQESEFEKRAMQHSGSLLQSDAAARVVSQAELAKLEGQRALEDSAWERELERMSSE
jgi:hypothetical protein